MDLYLIVKHENGNLKPLCFRDSYEDALNKVNSLQHTFPKVKFDIYQQETPLENYDKRSDV